MKHYIPLLENRIIPKEILKNFGKVLFGDFRGFKERDTDYERRVFDYLTKWIHGDFMDLPLKKEVEDVFMELHSIKQYYSDILEPKQRTLYRAMVLSKDELPFNKNELVKTELGEYETTKKFPYIPTNIVQSWTTSLDRAQEFSNRILETNFIIPDGVYVVIKYTFPKEELLFTPVFMNELYADESIKWSDTDDMPQTEEEFYQDEVIHIGKKSISVKYILSKQEYNKL